VLATVVLSLGAGSHVVLRLAWLLGRWLLLCSRRSSRGLVRITGSLRVRVRLCCFGLLGVFLWWGSGRGGGGRRNGERGEKDDDGRLLVGVRLSVVVVGVHSLVFMSRVCFIVLSGSFWFCAKVLRGWCLFACRLLSCGSSFVFCAVCSSSIGCGAVGRTQG